MSMNSSTNSILHEPIFANFEGIEPHYILPRKLFFIYSLYSYLPPLYYALDIYYGSLVIVEDIGVEPMTPCVQGRCSGQLS